MFKKIIVLLVLITSIVLSQGWNDIKPTNISLANANYAEMFSNSFGNNVILQNINGSITYYVVNASTGLANNAITVVTSGASLAQITGEAQKVYVIYKNTSTNKIVGKFSTNSGIDWTPLNYELNVNPSTLDAVAYGGKIHITYTQDNKAHYYQYDGTSWTKYKDVSGSEFGYNPSIELLPSSNKLYVAYNGPNGSAKSRECDIIENSWNELKTLYSYLNIPNIAGFGVDANYVYLYYSTIDNYPSDFYYTFYTRKIQKSDYTTVALTWESHNSTQFVQTTTTYDNTVHSAFFYWGVNPMDGYQSFDLHPGLLHDDINNGTRNLENIEVNYNYEDYYNVEVSSTSNDVFVLWKPENSNTLKYCQYDAIPLAPQNLSVSASSNNHPLLSWTKNNEADLDYYKVYKYAYAEQGWYLHGTTANNSFEDVNETYLTGGAVANEHWVYYKIKAVDKNPNPYESEYSNQVGARVRGSALEKISNSAPNGYSLDQNYPNPFNPSTKISYSIKEEGLVTLKVYDVLGKVVTTLVNENKPAGNYQADFNATQLPSGVYIYTLQVNGFTSSKKMLLMK